MESIGILTLEIMVTELVTLGQESRRKKELVLVQTRGLCDSEANIKKDLLGI